MSPELRQFLTDWLDWAEAGGSGVAFRQYYSLCSNLKLYCQGFEVVKTTILLQELKKLFIYKGLDEKYPFGQAQFENDVFNYSMHKCEKRLAFVRKVLSEN